MEAEKRVGKEIVERCPGPVPVVGELRVGAIAGDAIFFPFGDVDVGNVLRHVSDVRISGKPKSALTL